MTRSPAGRTRRISTWARVFQVRRLRSTVVRSSGKARWRPKTCGGRSSFVTFFTFDSARRRFISGRRRERLSMVPEGGGPRDDLDLLALRDHAGEVLEFL